MVHVYLYPSLLATLLAFHAYAAPTYNPNVLLRRQDAPFDGPQTVLSHDIIPANGGNIVRDCTTTFSPIVVDGQNLVREERVCVDVFVPAGQPLPPPPPPATTNTATETQSTPPPPPPAETTSTPPPDTTTTESDASETSSAPPADETTSSDATSTTDSPPPADSTTDSATSTDSAPPPGSTDIAGNSPAPAATSTDDGGSKAPTSESPDNVPIATGSTTGTREGAEAGPSESAAASNVEIPGKKFEVLPIGLGVFAGISVIALIVVGLVTYERTKYRKAFRARRLAASGAEMGYGGMSERR